MKNANNDTPREARFYLPLFDRGPPIRPAYARGFGYHILIVLFCEMSFSPDDLSPEVIELIRRIQKRVDQSYFEDNPLESEVTFKLPLPFFMMAAAVNLAGKTGNLSRDDIERATQWPISPEMQKQAERQLYEVLANWFSDHYDRQAHAVETLAPHIPR